jgi:hypothetical protein
MTVFKWKRSNLGLSDNFQILSENDEEFGFVRFNGFFRDAILKTENETFIFRYVKGICQIWIGNKLIGFSTNSKNELSVNAKLYTLDRVLRKWINSNNNIVCSVDLPSPKSPLYGFFNLDNGKEDYLLLCISEIFIARIKKFKLALGMTIGICILFLLLFLKIYVFGQT